MKTKTTRLPDPLAAQLEAIAAANRMSEGRVLELATEQLVAEVRKTGRLPLPPMKLEDAPEPAIA
jgi:predicted transcriptional regulator